ncbi:MAG: right-handed parallel beta-helix repeat-containing protein [Spirochaetales bacterium]|nr:right-handed parallel beta-helix repeat-containing protein [Spirochaetales bacterium]
MGSPWFTEPLYINSNTTIVLEEGAEIHAKQGSFHKGGASLFNLVNIDNITIYGYGARIKMHKDDYRKPPYKKAQWRMAINIKGCKDISILGLTAESSGGDGLYLGSGDRGFNENIVIKDVTLRDHFRQGISVISAKNLLIENTEMSYTEGHSPAAGIDFEPNKPDETFINCTVRNCVIRNNSGPGILICVKAHNEDTVPFDITIEDSYVFNNFIAIHILESKKMAGGTLVLRNTILNGFQFIPSIDSLNIIKE